MKKLNTINAMFLLVAALFLCSCADDELKETDSQNKNPEPLEARYTTYEGLVMTGYQGWFNTSDDGMSLSWTHYSSGGKFEPGSSSIDFWPEMDEYPKKYVTPFTFANGNAAYVFSSADYDTTDLHFKWMQEYDIDGVFLQRFLSSTRNTNNKAHRAQVTRNVIKASIKYERAWSLMYDIGGQTAEEIYDLVADLAELEELFGMSDLEQNPNYLYHNSKPLLAIYGVGFSTKEADGSFMSADLLDLLESSGIIDRYSIMLGTPYNWEINSGDATDDPNFHELIKRCDIVLPWAVGRYKQTNYTSTVTDKIASNVAWCETYGVDYAQLIFPGFSWGNLQSDYSLYDAFPRNSGDFMWMQIWGAYTQGVKMYYMAMFDEVDEGTAIFKCQGADELPLNGDGRFVGYDTDIKSDHYMWLAGKAKDLLNGGDGYSSTQPTRE